MTENGVDTTFTYNDWGRTVTKQKTVGQTTYTAAYAYRFIELQTRTTNGLVRGSFHPFFIRVGSSSLPSWPPPSACRRRFYPFFIRVGSSSHGQRVLRLLGGVSIPSSSGWVQRVSDTFGNHELSRVSIPSSSGWVQREGHAQEGRAGLHSLRVTFASMLAAGGVPLATAQVLMRHSTPTLTAKHYLDPAMLDTRGAVERLPSLTGADNPVRHVAQNVAQNVARTECLFSQNPAKSCKTGIGIQDGKRSHNYEQKTPVFQGKTPVLRGM